jgi:hypothetical protein
MPRLWPVEARPNQATLLCLEQWPNWVGLSLDCVCSPLEAGPAVQNSPRIGCFALRGAELPSYGEIWRMSIVWPRGLFWLWEAGLRESKVRLNTNMRSQGAAEPMSHLSKHVLQTAPACMPRGYLKGREFLDYTLEREPSGPLSLARVSN